MRLPVKKILRAIGWVFGGTLILLCLTAGGLLIWLRTDHAEKTIARLAADALAEQGLFLSLDSLSGPLPSRLLLTNVRLADVSGPWFAAKELEIKLNLPDLLRKTATVSLFRADTPEVYRLPALPPSPDEMPAEPVSPASPGYFNLPIGVRLEKASVSNLGLFADLLFPQPAAGDASPPDIQETADRRAAFPLIRASLEGAARADAGEALEAGVSLNVNLEDMPALEKRLDLNLPLDAFGLTADITARVGDVIEAMVKGTATASGAGAAYPVTLDLRARLDGEKAVLHKAEISGIGLTLAARGNADLKTNALQADVDFRSAAGGEWEKLLAGLTGQNFGGAARVAAHAAMEPGGTLNADLDVTGSSMRWGMPRLDGLLGPELKLTATVHGGGPAPYMLDLETLAAGNIASSGTASFSPADTAVKAALSATLADLSPLVPDVSGALTATADVSGTLTAPAVSLTVTSDAITNPSASLEKVRLAASLAGTLTAPVFSLAATSEGIRTQAGVFGNFRAAVDGNAALPPDGGKTIQARADISAAASPAGPLALHTAATAAQTASGAVTARLYDLALTLAGTDLHGDITAKIPAGGGSSAIPSIEGAASVSITDWRPISALSGMPVTGSRAGLDANFSHDGTVQHITAAISAQSLTLPDAFSLNGLNGTLTIRDLNNPNIALALAMGKGEAGPVNWTTGALAVNAANGDGAFAAALRSDNSASGALERLRRAAPAQPKDTERLTLAGGFSLSRMRVEIDRFAARLPDSPLGIYLPSPATVTLGDRMSVENLALNVVPGKGSVVVNAALDAVNATLDATITELPFNLIRKATGAPTPDGSLSAEAAITKRGRALQGRFGASATMYPPTTSGKKPKPVLFTFAGSLDQQADPNFPHLRSGGGVSRLKGSATLGFAPRKSRGAVENAPENAPDARINFNIPVQVAASGVPEPAMTAPIGGTIAWRGDIAPIWALVPMPDRSLSGVAQVDAELKGSLGKPDYSVNAYVAGGRFEDHILGVLLTDIAVQANATPAESMLIMRAEDGQGGSVAVEGALTQARHEDGGGTVPGIRARGQIDRLQPLHRDDISLRLSGRFSVDGPLDSMKVTAETEVERGQISIANIAGGIRTLPVQDASKEPKAAGTGPMLDVTVTIPNRFHIRGRGLDSEWEGELAVRGPASAPELTGSLRPVRGYFDLLSRTFAFSEGDITFFGGDRIDPALNLALTYQTTNITAIVRAKGTASKPEIVMESLPSLPQDQIMAEVLFGKNFSRLSRFEALQVANGVRQLANIGGGDGGGGLNPLATMRTALGIDMLRVGSSETGGGGDSRSVSGAPSASSVTGANTSSSSNDREFTPTLQAGKYINNSIYIGVEQGATADSTGVRVEVELRPNLNLQGRTTNRSSEVGLGWKRDY